MANRPITQHTKVAVGSLILGVPFNVFDEEVYNGLTNTEATAIINRSEVGGAHNVASDVTVSGLRNITLHQIRMKNAAQVGLRPSWASVTTAETTIGNNLTLATNKRLTYYTNYSTPVVPLFNLLINALSASQLRLVQEFELYMRGSGLFTSAKGKITGISPINNAPIEYSHIVTLDNDDWLIVNTNPQWADFIL